MFYFFSKKNFNNVLFFLLAFSSCFFYGCATQGFNSNNGPDWPHHPPFDKEGKIIYGVGSCSSIFSIDSNHQREKAILAAAGNIGLQYGGVRVKGITKNDNGKFTYYSVQLSNGKIVPIRVMDYWNDKERDMLYVLAATDPNIY